MSHTAYSVPVNSDGKGFVKTVKSLVHGVQMDYT